MAMLNGHYGHNGERSLGFGQVSLGGGYGIRLSDPDNLAAPFAIRQEAVGRGRFAGWNSVLPLVYTNLETPPHEISPPAFPTRPYYRATMATPFFPGA